MFVKQETPSTVFQVIFYTLTAEVPREMMKRTFAVSAIAFSIFLIKALLVVGTTAKLNRNFAIITLEISLSTLALAIALLVYSIVRDVFAGLFTGLATFDSKKGLNAFLKESSRTFSAAIAVGGWIKNKCYRVATI